MEKNKEIAELMFGTTKIRPNGNHAVKPEEILAPFDEADSAARFFCTDCGTSAEINEGEARQYALCAKVEFKKEKGGYFETDGCPYCLKRPTAVEYKIINIQ